jgi:hypothetical protein
VSTTEPPPASHRANQREYCEYEGLATAALGWSSPSTLEQVVPKERLYPSDGATSGEDGEPEAPRSRAPSAVQVPAAAKS